MKVAFVKCLALTTVSAFSNLFVSLIRQHIPNSIRIIVQMTIIASLVILVDQILKAVAYDISKQLSVFVALIITNCIILGRLEAYAMGNKPYDSVLDALGSSVGYAWIILVVAFFRELLGSGSILGWKVFEAVGWDTFPTNGLFVDSIGAFIILGLLIWAQRTRNGYIEN